MGKDKYPHPKKGERVACLGCGGTGRVVVFYRGKPISRSCIACEGKGYYVA